MARTATATVTKAATKRANNKTSKPNKSDKPKRAPSAYNLFVQANMKPWLEAHKDKTVKNAMVEIGALWRNAPENPNRGKEVAAKKSKVTKGDGGKPKDSKASVKVTKPVLDAEKASSEVDPEETDDQ